MRLVALVLALATVTGCTTRRQSLIVLGVSGTASLAGGAMLYSMRNDDDPPEGLMKLSAVLFIAGGLVALASGVGAVLPPPDDEPVRPHLAVAAYDACAKQRGAVLAHANTLDDADAREHELAQAPDCGTPPTSAERAQLRDATREHAWVITKAAATAARSGDCESVKRADADVATLDRDFHDAVFRADVAIAGCLR